MSLVLQMIEITHKAAVRHIYGPETVVLVAIHCGHGLGACMLILAARTIAALYTPAVRLLLETASAGFADMYSCMNGC